MKITQQMQEFFLRYFYHPFPKWEQTSFQGNIKEAKNILVYCPNQSSITEYRKQLNKVFKRCFINIIYPISSATKAITHTKNFQSYPVSSGSIIKTHRLSQFDKLIQKQYDLFIDLDPDPNLVNMYLCRMLRPGVSIGYEKAYAKFYYNFLIHSTASLPAPDRLKTICRMISCMREKKRPPKPEQSSLF